MRTAKLGPWPGRKHCASGITTPVHQATRLLVEHIACKCRGLQSAQSVDMSDLKQYLTLDPEQQAALRRYTNNIDLLKELFPTYHPQAAAKSETQVDDEGRPRAVQNPPAAAAPTEQRVPEACGTAASSDPEH